MGQIIKFQILMNFYRRDSRTILYVKTKRKKNRLPNFYKE